MHLFLLILLWWALIGGTIPAVILSKPIFVDGKWTARKILLYTFAVGPQTWAFLFGCWLCGLALALRHRMQRGKNLVPPGTIAPAADGKKA